MFSEREINQKAGDLFRRLFSDQTFYLFAWYEPRDVLWGFQLIYHFPGRPSLMVTWQPKDPAWLHHALSEGAKGESLHGTGSDMTKIEADLFDNVEVLARFKAAAGSLEPSLRTFVEGKLASHPDSWKPCRHCAAGRPASLGCGYCRQSACSECVQSRVVDKAPCSGSRHHWSSRWGSAA